MNRDDVKVGEWYVGGLDCRDVYKKTPSGEFQCSASLVGVANQIAREHNTHAVLVEAATYVHDWLRSFSMPPSSTIKEKQEALAILAAALKAAGVEG